MLRSGKNTVTTKQEKFTTAIWIEGTDLIVLQTFFKLVFKTRKPEFFSPWHTTPMKNLSNNPKQAIFKIASSLSWQGSHEMKTHFWYTANNMYM